MTRIIKVTAEARDLRPWNIRTKARKRRPAKTGKNRADQQGLKEGPDHRQEQQGNAQDQQQHKYRAKLRGVHLRRIHESYRE